MAKKRTSLDNFELFYEELGRSRAERTLDETKKDTAYERSAGLDEDQIAKLSDDLRTPIKDQSTESNPMR